jgi:hypothetical protein
MGTPVELLIVNSVMNMLAQNPERYRGTLGLQKRYEYALPVGGSGTSGAYPVLLQFDGEPVDIAIFDDAVPAPKGVGTLYRETYRALRDHDLDRFLQHFTEKSQGKWRKWYTSMAPGTADQFLAAMTKDRSLKFILDAGPFYIVFHGDPKTWTAGSLKYDYIVKMPKSGELKFANVSEYSFFDDVLDNPALFDQNVLRRPTEAEKRTQ